MVNTKLAEKSVAFFEIVASTEAEQRRMAHQDWPAVLSALQGADLAARAWDGADRRIFGNVYSLEGVDRLTLHKVRDASDWLQRVDLTSGNVDDIEAAAGEGIVDTSVIHFAEFGNLVGMIQGGISAPSHAALQGWLNHLNPFGIDLAVRPVMTQAEQERLNTASHASTFEIQLPARARSQLRAASEGPSEGKPHMPSLGQWLADAPVDEALTLSIRVSSPRGKRFDSARWGLRGQVAELFPFIPEDSGKVEATLFHGFEDNLGKARLTELVEHAITVKRRIPVVDEDGNSIRVQGAFQVIESVIIEHEDLLRRALDA